MEEIYKDDSIYKPQQQGGIGGHGLGVVFYGMPGGNIFQKNSYLGASLTCYNNYNNIFDVFCNLSMVFEPSSTDIASLAGALPIFRWIKKRSLKPA